MAKRDNKHERRIKRFIVGTGLFTILLATSTYAWFIGMKTVNVSPFDVKVAAIDGLSLSLDGITWADTVSINKDNYNVATYTGNTNTWGGTGLIPISTVGVVSDTTSKLVMYEKGSLTVTPGGYRLMASLVENTAGAEKSGYVAFDLFIKNLSGNEYYSEYNQLNEEAIYLEPDSMVKVGSAGVADTGIENSVRVAFAQIGRVVATTTDSTTIQGISCAETSGVTTICSKRKATIWEPNDTDHAANAINWYSKACKKRTGEDLTLGASYEGACKTVEDGKYSKTYAVSGVIDYTDRVDVYDGTDYNEYTTSIASTPTAGKLNEVDYFTDTEKNLRGNDRPEFITLAPNSITKVRIYIYIEGQDVDNYDFASLGKQIAVNFSLSKERYFGEDVDYNDEGTATLPDDVIYENHKDPTNTATAGN
ncbi:MAG: hypothetical protein PUA90_00655 [bacterium]|nr:hypothetical protein [bacterium]